MAGIQSGCGINATAGLRVPAVLAKSIELLWITVDDAQ
jgi:hypothetical protein